MAKTNKALFNLELEWKKIDTKWFKLYVKGGKIGAALIKAEEEEKSAQDKWEKMCRKWWKIKKSGLNMEKVNAKLRKSVIERDRTKVQSKKLSSYFWGMEDRYNRLLKEKRAMGIIRDSFYRKRRQHENN